MAERQKDKEKGEAEKISDEQRKKMLQEQAKATGPAIKNEPPPKEKTKEELAKEVGKEASKAEDFAKELEKVVGTPPPKGGSQTAPPSMERQAPKIEEIPGPPTYPQSEASLYEKVPQQQFQMSNEQFGMLVKDMTSLPVEVDIEKFKKFPGLTPAEASDLFSNSVGSKMGTLKSVAERYDGMMKDLATKIYPQAFKPVDGFELASGERVFIGSPINFMNGYTGVPVYIQQGGRTQLTIAYRSGSQGCWRRFSGADYFSDSIEEGGKEIPVLRSHYYKGAGRETGNEDWQNMDHRIQKRIDAVVSKTPALDLTKKMQGEKIKGLNITALNIRGRGGNEGLVVLSEEALQKSAAKNAMTLDIAQKGNEPDLSKVVTYWTASGNPLYKQQLNAVVESANGNFRYGITLTPHGVFVQYVEDNTQRGINRAGSPSRAVKLSKSSSWLLTPVVEYAQQADIDKKGIRYHAPRMPRGRGGATGEEHIPGHRIIFDNLHTEDSPFIAFSDANPLLKDVYGALRAGKPGDAQAAFGKWMKLPPKERI